MSWPKDSAGHRMTTEVPLATPNQTVSELRAMILKDITKLKTINYVYVLDEAKKLLGVLSLKDLYRADANARMGDVCKKTSLISVKPTTDQERVVYLALKNNIKAIPVVDRDHVFLGCIPSDTILTILHT